MDFIEQIRVGQERAKARIGAKQDRPTAIFSSGKIGRVRVAKDPPTEGDEFRWTGLVPTVGTLSRKSGHP